MTQEEIFKLASSKDRTELTNIWQVLGDEERKYFKKVADCYNKMTELSKNLDMTEQQKNIFLEKASKNLYDEKRLCDIAFSICSLYKSEYDIKEDAEEKLNLLCAPDISNVRSGQIYIAIVKGLTLNEINECLKASDEEIVEKTKEVYCKHYDKVYKKEVREDNFAEINEDFR